MGVPPPIANKGFDLVKDVREISEEMSEMKSGGTIGLTRPGRAHASMWWDGASIFQAIKDANVTKAQSAQRGEQHARQG